MDIAKASFHSKKNGIPFSEDLHFNKKYYWKCTKNSCHTYSCSFKERLRRTAFSDGNGCPRCIYYGEEVICEFLRTKNIKYEREKKFPWAPYLSRYDIYLPEKNILLEIDGEQHFFGKRKWGTANEIRKKDIYKMQTAFSQGFSIIRIRQKDLLDKSKFNWKSLLEEMLDLCYTPKTLGIITSDPILYNNHLIDVQHI